MGKKTTPARKSAASKNAGAAKRGAQPKAGRTGAQPALQAERGSSSARRSHNSKSTNVAKKTGETAAQSTGANAQSQQAELIEDVKEEIEETKEIKNHRNDFPARFPFWARLKIGKKRTTLVIDEEPVVNKQNKKVEDGFVHREATHIWGKDKEEIKPNPDGTDPEPMYLKRPRKLPQRLFKPHNKDLDMPEELIKRYEGNNDKKQ